MYLFPKITFHHLPIETALIPITSMASDPVRLSQNGVEYIGMPVASITSAQLAKLEKVKDGLPERFDILSPILDQLISSYKSSVPPHQGPLIVSALDA